MSKYQDPNSGIRDSSNKFVFAGGQIRTSIFNTAVTVTTTATALPTVPLFDRTFLTIQNLGNAAIYIGDSTVTTTTGIEILPHSDRTYPVEDTVTIYGICATGTVSCIVQEGK